MTMDTVLHKLVILDGGCWEYPGRYNRIHYKQVYVQGRIHDLHRLVYEMLRGTVEEGLELDHLCRNPPCCNPDHLEPVTHAENMRRGLLGVLRPPRTPRTHCGQGHAYEGENVYAYRGYIRCRTCQRAYYQKIKESPALLGELRLYQRQRRKLLSQRI